MEMETNTDYGFKCLSEKAQVIWKPQHLAMWLHTNTLLNQIGRDLGFVETEQKRYFCCKVLDECYSWLEDPNRWFVTMADSEIY